MRGIIPIFVFCCVFSIFPHFLYAQSPNVAFALKTSPEFPEPEEIYTVSVTGYGSNKSEIRWYIDSVEDTQQRNLESITLTAPKSGKTSISAKVILTDKSEVVASRTISPYRIDLVVESDTVVPPFYKGRSLPTSGSTVTVTALVFDQNFSSSDTYAYLWKVNGKAQSMSPIQGKNTIAFTPNFEKEALIELAVTSSSGVVVAQEAKLVTIVKPEIYFYEKNPLRGLSFVALKDPHIFIGDEIHVRAEGYFMSRNMLSANVLRQWEINNREVVSGSGDPNEITLTKQGNDGTSKLSFHIRNLSQLLQGVEKVIQIQF